MRKPESLVIESLLIVALAVAGLTAFGTGQASATHVSCGDEITTDTTLDSDLVDCPNNGIVIGADDITLDLNGYLVDGDGTPEVGCTFCDLGLLNRGHDGVTVRDGSAREFAVSVFAHPPVRHNRVLGITSSGLGGSMFVYGNRNVIARNQVRGGGGVGLDGRANVVADNVVVGARQSGISLGGGNNTVRRNLVKGGRDGFWVGEGHGRGLLKRNVAVGAEDDGFAVRTHEAMKLTRNRAVRNGDLGINALRGVIDGGGNRAHGNGNPAQCINIACK